MPVQDQLDSSPNRSRHSVHAPLEIRGFCGYGVDTPIGSIGDETIVINGGRGSCQGADAPHETGLVIGVSAKVGFGTIFPCIDPTYPNQRGLEIDLEKLKGNFIFLSGLSIASIIGIGVDYGVHLLHRWYESGGILFRSENIAVIINSTIICNFWDRYIV